MNAYSIPSRTRRTAPSLVLAASLLLLPLSGATSVRAQETVPPVAVDHLRDTPSIDSVATVLDLRDAPVSKGLEMLFAAGHSQFSVENSVFGFITMKAGEQSLRKDMRSLCSASAQPLSYKVDKNVFYVSGDTVPAQAVQSFQIVRTFQAGAPVAAPVAASVATPSSVTDVPRRVAGVLILKSGAAYAILETGLPGGPTTRVTVVEYKTEATSQSPTRVPSGIAGVPDLSVTGINATGVTLTGSDGTTIQVPLKAATTP